MFLNKKTYQIILALGVLILIASPFVYKTIAATGLSVGSSTLSGTDDVIYGHGGDSTGSLLNLVNNAGSSFVIDSSGNLDLSGTVSSGGLTDTINAGNISSGEFGSNTGGGNYSFPANLGIGTTNPGAKLDIVGSIAKITNTGAGTAFVVERTDGGAAALQAGGTVPVARFLFDEAGDFMIQSNSRANVLSATGNGPNRMVVKGDTGNVGIGTTSPAYKLDVDGTGRFTGKLIVDSPSSDNHAATKSYVDSAIVSADGYIGDSGGHTAGGSLNMNNNLITNIGNSGTDFISGGGLNLAGDFDVKDIITRDVTKGDYNTGTDHVMLLAPADSSHNIVGSLYYTRTSSHKGTGEIDILYSTGSTATNRDANLHVQQADYYAGDYSLVIFDVGGTDYIGLRREGPRYFITEARFEGYSSYKGSDFGTWYETPAGTTDIPLTGKNYYSGDLEVDGSITLGSVVNDNHAVTKSYVDSVTGGDSLPTGTNGQTLYNSGGTWTASSNLYHNGTNVGIGTSSPAHDLSVVGSDSNTSTIFAQNTTNSSLDSGTRLLLNNGYVDAYFRTYSRSANNTLAGFNKANAVFLATDRSTVASEFIVGTHDADPLHFMTDSAGRMTITSAGDVGIGTKNPTGKLDVNGSIVTNSVKATASTDLEIDASSGTGNVVITIGN